MIGIIIAILSGLLMSVQGVFNTELTKQAGVWVTASWVQLTGFLACFLIWLFAEKNSTPMTGIVKVDNKYMLISGVIGAFITFTVIKSMSELSPAKAVMIIVISQLLTAYIIELIGLFGVQKAPLSLGKVVGVIIAIIGIVIFQWEKS